MKKRLLYFALVLLSIATGVAQAQDSPTSQPAIPDSAPAMQYSDNEEVTPQVPVVPEDEQPSSGPADDSLDTGEAQAPTSSDSFDEQGEAEEAEPFDGSPLDAVLRGGVTTASCAAASCAGGVCASVPVIFGTLTCLSAAAHPLIAIVVLYVGLYGTVACSSCGGLTAGPLGMVAAGLAYDHNLASVVAAGASLFSSMGSTLTGLVLLFASHPVITSLNLPEDVAVTTQSVVSYTSLFMIVAAPVIALIVYNVAAPVMGGVLEEGSDTGEQVGEPMDETVGVYSSTEYRESGGAVSW